MNMKRQITPMNSDKMNKNNKKPNRFGLINSISIILLFLFFISSVYSVIYEENSKNITIPISELIHDIGMGKVLSIVVKSDDIIVEYQDKTIKNSKKETDASVTETFERYGLTPEKLNAIKISVEGPSGFWFWIGQMAPFLLPVIFLMFIIWFLSWLTAVFSTEVIVLTKNDLASTIKFLFLPDNKFCLIPNGIDTDAISFFPQEQARKELGLELEPSAIIIGGITEFTKNKGVQYLIEAAKALPKSVRVAFISGGERKSQMEKFAKDFGVSERIHFLGFKQDAAKYLKAFDIFVFPSIKEGLPYSLLEAGLAELSIVASNVGGIPDIITNEENGLLVEPKSSHALAKAIKKLLENKEKREQFGKKISEKIKTDFSFASMLEKTIEIYKTNQS